jgi:sugar/nucleoside kinase (ribokinase family)
MTQDHSAEPGGAAALPVCIVGNLLVDLIVPGVPRLPAWGQEVAGSRRRTVASGQAGYMAQALATFGAGVGVVSVVGADDGGAMILAALDRAGVDTSAVRSSAEAPTALTIVLVRADGERAFVSDFSALRELDEAAIGESWPTARQGAVALVGLFNLPGLPPAAAGRVLERARAEGRTTLLDTGWDPDGWSTQTITAVCDLLAHVDVFAPNLDEARVLTGHDDPEQAAAALAAHAPGSLIVVKCGADGAVARRDGTAWSARGHRVTVCDAVGAGDVFDAGLLFALQRGAGVREALAWANAAAATYVSRATNRFPRHDEVAAMTGATPSWSPA